MVVGKLVLFGSRRRFEKKISVLLWWFGKNSLLPISSRTFWKQSYWSYVTGQCSDWEWNLSLYLPHRMRVQSSFYSLLAHWSKRRKSQRSGTYWLLCTTSSAIRAQCMEEASRRGILGWYWSCYQRRINILSNTIKCNYSSRDTSSLLHSKSWKIEKRSCMKDNICLLDHHQRSLWNTITIGPEGISIGFYSWTTASLKTRSTVFWRGTTCQAFQTNPIQTQSTLWSIGETWGHRTCFCGKRKKVPFTRDRW